MTDKIVTIPSVTIQVQPVLAASAPEVLFKTPFVLDGAEELKRLIPAN